MSCKLLKTLLKHLNNSNVSIQISALRYIYEAFLNDFSDSDNWCGSDITVCNAYFSHFIVNMLSVTIY